MNTRWKYTWRNMTDRQCLSLAVLANGSLLVLWIASSVTFILISQHAGC